MTCMPWLCIFPACTTELFCALLKCVQCVCALFKYVPLSSGCICSCPSTWSGVQTTAVLWTLGEVHTEISLSVWNCIPPKVILIIGNGCKSLLLGYEEATFGILDNRELIVPLGGTLNQIFYGISIAESLSISVTWMNQTATSVYKLIALLRYPQQCL